MLQVARLAPDLLQEAADRAAAFLLSQFADDGGVRDKSGKSDLYYTVFGLDGLIALRRDPPLDRVRPYLERFGGGEGLDLVHLGCLARCWAAFARGTFPHGLELAQRIEAHRQPDGGFGSVYQDFIALGSRQDLGLCLDGQERLADSIARLQLPGGGFANQPDLPAATAPTTAAGMTLLRTLGRPVPAGAAEFLLGLAHPKGGFVAAPGAPLPDLLSTATSLHALAGAHVPIAGLKEACLDFIDTLWTGRGFCGTWEEEAPDAEYTFYGLLALGHLSLA
jgi:prenyltransferase beta subunit